MPGVRSPWRSIAARRAAGGGWVLGALLLAGAGAAQEGDSEPAPEQAPAPQAAEEAEPGEPEGPPLDDSGAEPEPGPVDTGIEKVRQPVDRLAEHYLGSASRPVRFDWRDAWVTVGATGGELIERNSFGSFRVGAVVRRAVFGLMVEGAASWVFVLGTQSSELLALTPYRQASRPSRVELDLNLSYPVFEGVVTPLFDFIPPSEVVISAAAGARYLFYPAVVVGERDWQRASTWTDFATWRSVGESLATAQLLEDDRELLERGAPAGMSIDPGLVHTLVGLNFDVYYQPGFWLSARPMLAVPALATVTGTRLAFWWELSLATGWAF